MAEVKPIYEVVDALPTSNITIQVLKVLDYVVPDGYQNLVGFENTIKAVTRETDQKMIQKIGERAIRLYNDKSQGYQRALWIYQVVDRVDDNLAKAALANKVGERIRILSFLSRLTPKADTLQTIDLSLKLVAELAAFCLINGLPGDSIGDFVKALTRYEHEARIRLAALIALDGIIPLGPDFIGLTSSALKRTKPRDLEDNTMFQQLRDFIPGADSASKLGFIVESFNSVQDWMASFVSSQGLTRERILSNIEKFVEISDSKLDYVAAFLDMTTNYFEHTGTQTVARQLIERAVNEI